MNESFTLVDRLALADLTVYLSRAQRVEDGAARLIAGSGVLAVYTAVLYPRGLMDRTPTVLGLRTFATDDAAAFDVVVPIRSLLGRLARVEDSGTAGAPAAAGDAEAGRSREGADEGEITVRLPLGVSTVTWAGISPPRTGWRQVGTTEIDVLTAAAAAGVTEVAEEIPPGTGEALVQRVRSEVWGRAVDGLDYVPAGAAFAADALGFIAERQPVTVYETGPWTRLTTRHGHVLVRRRAWTLRA